MDIDSDVEAAATPTTSKAPSIAPPAYDPPRGSAANRDASPLPAPVPQKPMTMPRESLDGDTIFAIEDEDKGSDSEDEDGGERTRLTSGKDL